MSSGGSHLRVSIVGSLIVTLLTVTPWRCNTSSTKAKILVTVSMLAHVICLINYCVNIFSLLDKLHVVNIYLCRHIFLTMRTLCWYYKLSIVTIKSMSQPLIEEYVPEKLPTSHNAHLAVKRKLPPRSPREVVILFKRAHTCEIHVVSSIIKDWRATLQRSIRILSAPYNTS